MCIQKKKKTGAWDPWWDFFCWQVFWKVLRGGDEGLTTGFLGFSFFLGLVFKGSFLMRVNVIWFALFCFLLMSSCSLIVQFQFVVWVFIFLFLWTLLCNNPLVSCSFPALLGLHCLVICFCLFILYLIIFLVIVWVFNFFILFFKKLQQSIWNNSTKCTTWNMFQLHVSKSL